MAPVKFENHLREKLEERRLKPSHQAWNTLSERLDKQNNNSNNKAYWWLGIAASLIGVFFVVTQFFGNEIKVEASPEVVDTPIRIKQDFNTQKANEGRKSGVINTAETKKVDTIATSIQLKTNNTENVLAASTEENTKKKETDITVKPVEIITKSLSFEDQQIKHIVAKVKAMEFDKNNVTDAAINVLLEEAQREIRLNNSIINSAGVVDANALLQEVEADLEQSFRTKVFEALKVSFKSVKTAVAQRND